MFSRQDMLSARTLGEKHWAAVAASRNGVVASAAEQIRRPSAERVVGVTESVSCAIPTHTPGNLAWALATELAPHLSKRDRNRVFATAVAGEAYDAIRQVLAAAVRRKIAVSEELTTAVAELSSAYHDAVGCMLRALVHEVRLIPTSETAS